jgi:multiple antibiotic resistance protein
MLDQVLRISVALFVIMDPFGSIPLFLLATKEAKEADKAATYAVGVAAAVLFFFLFLGNPLFQALGIELTSLRIGGGIVLAVLAMELVLGRGFTKMIPKGSPALSLIGTPMLTGPGVIASTMIFVQSYGYLPTLLASIPVLISSWIVLRLSLYIHRAIGRDGIEIISRIMGLLLMTIAVNLVMQGIKMTLS